MRDRPDDAHLDDYAQSAAVDGFATPDEQAHLATCAVCRDAVSAMRRVSSAIAQLPPGASESQRERHIATAVSAVGTRGDDLLPRTYRLGAAARRLPRAVPALAAAAALLVALALVPLLARTTGGRPTADTAETGRAPSSEAPASGATDLGPVDEAGLRAAIEAAFGGPSSAGAAKASPAPLSSATAAGDEASGHSSASAGITAGSTGEDVPTPRAATPSSPLSTCEATLRRDAPKLGPTAFRALGSWKGTPAVVIAVGQDPARDVAVYVMARNGCRILHFLRLRPGS